MKRTTVFLDEDLERDVKALAERQGRPAASLVREALAEYVHRHRPVGLGLSFVAAGRSGHSDVAERHEEILAQELDPHPAGEEA
jgi:predicted transcriptional regulator